MYGNHTRERAAEIAAQKTTETGKRHIIIESEDEPGKWTIGVPLKSIMTGDNLRELIESRLKGK